MAMMMATRRFVSSHLSASACSSSGVLGVEGGWHERGSSRARGRGGRVQVLTSIVEPSTDVGGGVFRGLGPHTLSSQSLAEGADRAGTGTEGLQVGWSGEHLVDL